VIDLVATYYKQRQIRMHKRMKNQNGQMPFTIRMLVLLMVPNVIACRKPENKSPRGIIDLFDTVFVETNKIQLPTTLKQLVFKSEIMNLLQNLLKIQTRSHCFF
jgi:hypothetical protein